MAAAASMGPQPVEENLRTLLGNVVGHVRGLVRLELAGRLVGPPRSHAPGGGRGAGQPGTARADGRAGGFARHRVAALARGGSGSMALAVADAVLDVFDHRR